MKSLKVRNVVIQYVNVDVTAIGIEGNYSSNTFRVLKQPSKQRRKSLLLQVAQLSPTNPRDALHHSKQQNFKTVT